MTTFLAIAALAWITGTPPQQSGEQGTYQRDSLQQIESGLIQYLNAEENMSILTPGEFCEWKQPMKSGQILVAGARSSAFDPALQIVDTQGTVVASNDDRYPGDQRPLVFWRCEKDGEYSVRARCFRDKSGGQVYVAFNVYDSMDATGEFREATVDATRPFFVRVPMKAGQVKDLVAEKQGQGNYLNFRFDRLVYPNGLPEHGVGYDESISPAIDGVVAPLDGDYYVLAVPYGYRGGAGKVRVASRDFVPVKVSDTSPQAPTNRPSLFEVSVKAGDLLELSVPDLVTSCKVSVGEAPDLSKFDLAKAELNPFFPAPRNRPPGPGPAIDRLPKRARDNRLIVFRARRDARIWFATDGAGEANKQYELHVRPAAQTLAEGSSNAGKLRVANTDYWSLEAKAGDVLTLGSSTPSFTALTVVRDPDLVEIRRQAAELDQTSDSWRMVVQKPGRYLIAMSCVGDGGGGEYTLSRKAIPAREFNLSTPAKGLLKPGEVQIWKFTAKPGEPLFVKWGSDNWSYGIDIYNEKGVPADFQRQAIDDHNRLGILTVGQPQSYVIVLTGSGQPANYNIELSSVNAVIKK